MSEITKHIHLIPADFEYYNLDDLKEENEGRKRICWSNGNPDGKNAQEFNIGDDVYIYFHDNRRLTDRILLKATVCDSDTTDGKNENPNEGKYLFTEYCQSILNDAEAMAKLSKDSQDDIIEWSKSKYHGFYLNEIGAITEEFEEEFKYIHKDEITDVKKQTPGLMGIRINQTKVYLDKQEDNELATLREKLENAKFSKRRMNILRDKYNNDACILCTASERDKHSFLKPNNLYYFEIHHILQQSLNNKKNKPKWCKKEYTQNKINTLIYNDFNEVRLCPYHHNYLHYGQFEQKKEYLDKIMKHQDYKNRLKEKVKSEDDCNAIIKYIYKQYGIEYK